MPHVFFQNSFIIPFYSIMKKVLRTLHNERSYMIVLRNSVKETKKDVKCRIKNDKYQVYFIRFPFIFSSKNDRILLKIQDIDHFITI